MFTALRQDARLFASSLRTQRVRSVTTGTPFKAYVPPAAPVEDGEQRPRAQDEKGGRGGQSRRQPRLYQGPNGWSLEPIIKTNLESPSAYTGYPEYFDTLHELEDALTVSQRALRKLNLLPLPQVALKSIPPAQPAWKTKSAIEEIVGAALKPSRFTRVMTVLKQLDEYRRIALLAGQFDISKSIQDVITVFERDDKATFLSKSRKPVPIDEYGRSYSMARRKESHARVWVISTRHAYKDATEEATTAPAEQDRSPSEQVVAELEAAITADSQPSKPKEIPVSQILINNVPLAQYFKNPSDRERVIRPLKITGLLGAYNVFALARGGGTTGQAGAVSVGIARCLTAQAPDVEKILRKAKLILRDPRMVERKKPGLRKARAARTWVKR